MTSNGDSNQTCRLVTVLFMGLLLLSSCQRSSTYLTASKGESFPGLSQPTRVSSRNADAAEPAIAASPDGSVYLAWVNHGPNKEANVMIENNHMESNRELFYATSMDGGHTFSANQRVASDVCPCCKTALAVSADGHLYLSWRQVLPGDLRHIAVASSSDQGKTFSSPKIVSDDQWVLAGCPVSGPSLSVDKNGVLSVLWYSAGTSGQTGLYWSQSNDHGATFEGRKLVSAGSTNGSPVVVTENGVMCGRLGGQ